MATDPFTAAMLMSPEEREEFIRQQRQMMGKKAEALCTLSSQIQSKRGDIEKLEKRITRAYQPNGRGSFLEAGEFTGYNTLSFFYSMAERLGKSLNTALRGLLETQRHCARGDMIYSQVHVNPGAPAEIELLAGIAVKNTAALHQWLIRDFEMIVKQEYQRAIDQFRYLQRRFLNLGADDSRAYRDPLEEQSGGGFDLARIPYVKIELIRDNALLTDLLLDIADNLPIERTRKIKQKGRKKPKEVKVIDAFDVDRSARILVELSDPTYQGYIKDPRGFLSGIAGSIGTFYGLLDALSPTFADFLLSQEDAIGGMLVNRFVLETPIPNPSSILSRLSAIDYTQVRPGDDETRPSNQLERKFFAARKTLLEHLADSIDAIGRENKPSEKFKIAKEAVEKGIKLREKARQSLETTHTLKIKKDKKTENEFYVGASEDHGAFTFVREAAPSVRLKDVYGKTFDAMKQHLTDLADYSKYMHLFSATAPRGKIRSNLIAIGPYGCGKTEIGRAIAGDPRFIGADVNVTNALTCWFGEFEKNVDRIWDAAKELRRNSGDSKLVFLLMDEFDSWFNKSDGHWVDSTYQRVQKAIQMKLDGVVDYEGVIVVGFTNEPARIPLAIYRRFKYVDIVGELEPQERADLLKKFITTGMPLSRGFREPHYKRWGEMLEGATGDVVGKVADDIHYELMRQFIAEHPVQGRRLNAMVRRMQLKHEGEIDRMAVKREVGRHLLVTPDWVEQRIQSKLAEPIIREQIETAKRVYAEARDVVANMYRRHDAASGSVCDSPMSLPRKDTNIV